MIGSGFVGWPFVVGALVILALIWWLQPLSDADAFTRRAIALGTIPALLVAAWEGGLYLIPSVVIRWL